MSAEHTCPTCGSPLAVAGPTAGSCPRCLLGLGRDEELVRTGGGPPAEPPPSPEELAPHFPDLEIEALLGTGGMGTVYRARQRRLDRVVALKILRRDVAERPEFAERFQREARALASLSHPGIVAVHDCGRAGPFTYLLMEYVEGANLRHLLRTGRLSPAETLALVGEVCDALQYAHARGVVHRDIKPENILVDTSGRAKIADFGLAKLMRMRAGDLTLTETAQSMGTLHYMAPEQLETPRSVDHRADLYSLGVVFYEMLTGELPLGRFRRPSEKVGVDVRIDEIVLRSLEKEPERRYQAAGDVRTDVDTVSRGPAAAPPPAEPPAKDASSDGPEEEPRRGWLSRRPSGCMAVAAGLAALLLFLPCLAGVGFLFVAPTRVTSTAELAPEPEVAPPPSRPSSRLSALLLTRDGARLSPSFVSRVGLTPDTARALADRLEATVATFDALIEDHLVAAEVEDDGVRVQLEAFPGELEELLADHRTGCAAVLGPDLWSRYRALLDLTPLAGVGDEPLRAIFRTVPRGPGEPPEHVVEVVAEGRTERYSFPQGLTLGLERVRRVAQR